MGKKYITKILLASTALFQALSAGRPIVSDFESTCCKETRCVLISSGMQADNYIQHKSCQGGNNLLSQKDREQSDLHL